MAIAASRSFPFGTTRLTMPSRSASCALTLSRPLKMISCACLGPVIHGNIITTMPALFWAAGTLGVLGVAFCVIGFWFPTAVHLF